MRVCLISVHFPTAPTAFIPYASYTPTSRCLTVEVVSEVSQWAKRHIFAALKLPQLRLAIPSNTE